MRTGINWTEDETILAFQLYLTTPFGKISENYPPIIELSKLLGRTSLFFVRMFLPHIMKHVASQAYHTHVC